MSRSSLVMAALACAVVIVIGWLLGTAPEASTPVPLADVRNSQVSDLSAAEAQLEAVVIPEPAIDLNPMRGSPSTTLDGKRDSSRDTVGPKFGWIEGSVEIQGEQVFRGRAVFAGARSEPLPGVSLGAFALNAPMGGPGTYVARTDADGHFSMGGIRGEVAIRLWSRSELTVIRGEKSFAGPEEHLVTVAGVLLEVWCHAEESTNERPILLPRLLSVTRVNGAPFDPDERATRRFPAATSRSESLLVDLALDSTYQFIAFDEQGERYEGTYRVTAESGRDELVLQKGAVLFGDVLVSAGRKGIPGTPSSRFSTVGRAARCGGTPTRSAAAMATCAGCSSAVSPSGKPSWPSYWRTPEPGLFPRRCNT